MSPVFFGRSEAPLFGIHHAPRGPRRALGALLCPPIGHEYMRSHWVMRRLARALAERGVATFRFDYHATGDSSGESDEGRVGRWLDDIALAAEELRDTSACRSITLVGLRLGAALGAIAASRGLELEHLVLWDPVVDGKQYLAELEAMQRGVPIDPMLFSLPVVRRRRLERAFREPAGGDELLGFPYAPPLRAGIADVDLRKLEPPLATRVSLVASAPDRGYAALPFEQLLVPDAGDWRSLRHFQQAVLAEAIPERIVTLVAEAA